MIPPRLMMFLSGLFAAAAVYWSCSGLDPLAGGTSETTNGFVAVVHGQSGTPVSRALVRLRPAAYLSDTAGGSVPYSDSAVVDTFTDTQGRFRITDIDTGKYTIEIQDGMGGAALIRSTALKDSIVDCGVAVIRPAGAISGIVDRGAAGSVTVYVRVYGLERVVSADPVTGSFTVSGVPQENYMLTFVTSSSSFPAREAAVSVTSGSTADAGTIVLFALPGWSFSRTIVLATDTAGAGISGDVLDFPVLVRLTAGDFTFSRAQADGGDLRFLKADGTLLPCEIERWDFVNGAAEVWVKVDTIFGSNDSQYIVMYWGNPDAADASNGAAVFDTAAGFQGVWHLGGNGDATAYDATGNHYDGTPYNMTAASSVNGAVGNARVFNGRSQYITMAATASSKLNFPEDGSYAMSVWVYADTLDSLWRAIAGKGHEQYYMQLKNFGNNRATWEFVEFQNQSGWEYTEDSVPPAPGGKTWLNLVGVRAGNSQRLYINGQLVKNGASLMGGAYARTTTDNFMIGRYQRSVTIPYPQGLSYFKGRIDEVRVASVVPGNDWIKLCYMNQKSGDALVKFR